MFPGDEMRCCTFVKIETAPGAQDRSPPTELPGRGARQPCTAAARRPTGARAPPAVPLPRLARTTLTWTLAPATLPVLASAGAGSMPPWRQRAPPVRRKSLVRVALELISWLPWFPLQTADQEGNGRRGTSPAVLERVGGDPARTSPSIPSPSRWCAVPFAIGPAFVRADVWGFCFLACWSLLPVCAWLDCL